MPTYQYQCKDCGEALEVVQKFTDDALTVCPNCQGELRKVFSAVGIVFKGSGFYRTDSRASSSSSTPPSVLLERRLRLLGLRVLGLRELGRVRQLGRFRLRQERVVVQVVVLVLVVEHVVLVVVKLGLVVVHKELSGARLPTGLSTGPPGLSTGRPPTGGQG